MFIKSIIILLTISISYANASWWYLGLQSNNTQLKLGKTISNKHCYNVKIFSSEVQRKLCLKNAKIFEIIRRGAKLAIDECQHQFKFNRWNCSIYNQTDVFGRLIKTRSRETAFIYAINSAAAMYEITRACARGDLKQCSCEQKLNTTQFKLGQNYEWGGCSDNVLFGYKLSKSFVDSKELQESKQKKRDNSFTVKEIKLMNLHNNEVGRRAILKNMKQVCKCHGVSGSCSIKVCWKVMADFRVIGNDLLKSYKIAAQLKETKVKERVKKLNQIVSKRYSRTLNEVSYKDDLIFIDKSPNFCKHNLRDGVMGTSGRICSDDSVTNSNDKNTIKKTCDYLCCGRGYITKVIELEEDCDCQFQWCCQVKCKRCKKRITQFICR